MLRRFVILKHDHPYMHWDLLLEEEESARAWRLLRKPCLCEPIAAEPLPPHRLLYLDYEGPLSNDRGRVEQFCTGSYMLDDAGHTRMRVQLLANSFATQADMATTPDGRVFFTFSNSGILP